jgi:iron(III) transport system permease protein
MMASGESKTFGFGRPRLGAQQALGLLLLVYFALVLGWPISSVIASGFQTAKGSWTLAYLSLILRDPLLLRGLLKAFAISLATTLTAVAIALPLAVLSVKFEFRAKRWLSAMTLLPMVLPPFVGALGMRMLLSRFGPLTLLIDSDSALGIDWLGQLRTLGVVVTEALGLYPIVLLNLQASLANLDPDGERAARNLGASKWQLFRRITLPLLRPGLFAGSTLVLIWSFTELGTPLMFQVHDVAPVQLYMRMSEIDSPLPHALVTVMLFASVLLYALGRLLLGRSNAAQATKAVRVSVPQTLQGARALAAALPFVVVVMLSLLPHVAVVLTSLSKTGAWYHSILPRQFTTVHYEKALQDPLIMPSWTAQHQSFGAIANSILYASAATLFGSAIALVAAFLIVRSKLRWRSLIDTLSMMPLAVPGLVLAFGYLSISVHFKHRWGAQTPAFLDAQQWPVGLLIVAYAARRLPYVVRSAVAGLEQTPVVLEHAAQNLGSGKARTWLKVTLPLLTAHLLAGALLAFTFALLEVSDSLLLAQTSEFYPITKAIWELSQRPGDGAYVASALGTWAMLLLGSSLLAVGALLNRKLGTLFRA